MVSRKERNRKLEEARKEIAAGLDRLKQQFEKMVKERMEMKPTTIPEALISEGAYDIAKSYIDFLKERDSRAEFAKKAAQIKKKTANLRKGLASSNKDALKTLAKITGFSEKKEEKARTPIHEEAADAHGKP
jgi:superfamily II RNA helicase